MFSNLLDICITLHENIKFEVLEFFLILRFWLNLRLGFLIKFKTKIIL